ncbi:MAG: YdcF family protein [Candidatus Omnitrophica bacterium]|nr:YdcF family protein [Candidatus Omnitrophota bacterium]
MLSGRDILCISSIDWDFIWQGHQEIMAALAAAGNRVLFIENTGVRAPRLRDLPRLKRRFLNWRKGTQGFRQERPNLFVYSPMILPFPYSRPARWINRALLLTPLRRWMRAAKFQPPVVWTFLPTPLVLDILRELDPELTVYYCIDDLASSSPQAQRITQSETQLFQRADLVFVTSEQLRQRAARFSGRVHLFPFGVSYRKFEEARRSPDGLPRDLDAVRRPIIGYIGGIHQWVDQELVAAVARQVPEASVVLVGPPQTDTSRLAECANVHLLGSKAHADVPRYIKGFDVGIVPYRLSEYTAHVYPTKLNEYLAMGIPVVATDLPEIRRFNVEHGAIVHVAQSAAEFIEAVRRAMDRSTARDVERSFAVARQNSWEVRIERMSSLIEQELIAREAAGWRWQESLRRLYRTARRRALKMAGGIALGYGLLFQSPFVWWLAEPLRLSQSPQPADAIVVLAGGVGESGKAGGGYQERIKRAVDLYRTGYAPRLIVSSGYTFVFREAEVMKELAVRLGVPEAAILLETDASNTVEHVRLTRDILQQAGWRRILLVSSPYHMRRALWTFRRQAPGLTVMPTPVTGSQFYAHERGASLEQILGILQEYAAIVWYWWSGWV